ncbi:MAG TPA: sulfur carrier protein ThiS [Thermoanaerobaculia bacterium]|nr:sulfur carrier protein ThiS [Thermoanaerobaculia bacterium]
MGEPSGVPEPAPAIGLSGRILVNGDPMEWWEGMTVRDVLKAKNYIFPLLITTVNGALIPRGSYDGAVVPCGADVKVVHLISGG